jgi:cold shock CspA family protein
MTGTVTRIFRSDSGGLRKDRGGYFFIRDEHGHDRFAHARDIGQSEFLFLQEGDSVEFEPLTVPNSPRGNGLRAESVRRV